MKKTFRNREWGARLTRLGLALGLALVLCFAAVPHGSAQQTGDFEWLLQFGLAGDDFAWDVHADGDGNVYVSGDASGALPGQIFAGPPFDGFVRRYNADGTEIWTRQFGTNRSDRNGAVFPFGQDLYVGWLTTGAFPGYVNLGLADAYLRKYDASGNEQWTRQFGTSGNDELVRIFVNTTGIYVCGRVGGQLPLQTHFGMLDAFVRKYDFDGNELWTKQFGALGQDTAFGVSGDATGVYVVGAIAGALPDQIPAGSADVFVRKYDVNGHELWTRQFGTSAIDLALGVSTNATGLYVVGRTDAVLPGQTAFGGADAFVRQYDHDGNELWTRQFGTTIFDLARGVSIRDSVVYVSGVVSGTGPGFPGGQVGADVFVRAYTAKGKHLWTRHFGSELADDNWAVAAGPSGLYVIGSATGTLPGLVSHGGIDAFVGKLVPEIVAEIDIKHERIKLGPGVLHVAILTSNTFDATTVDPTTVALEGAAVRHTKIKDVNGDGLDDLDLHLDKEALQLTPNDTIAEMTARTFGGRVVFGFDSVRIEP